MSLSRITQQDALETFAQIKPEPYRMRTKRTNRCVQGEEADDVSEMISELRTKNTTSTAAASAAKIKEKEDDEPDASSAPSHQENTVASENQQPRFCIGTKTNQHTKKHKHPCEKGGPRKIMVHM